MHFHWACQVQEVGLRCRKNLHSLQLRHFTQPAHWSEVRAPEIISSQHLLGLLMKYKEIELSGYTFNIKAISLKIMCS